MNIKTVNYTKINKWFFYSKCFKIYILKTAFVNFNSIKAELTQINFEKLDFGDTEALDKFYNADVALVDMSLEYQQLSLSYHIGVRESMSMPETVILLHDTNPGFTISVNLTSKKTDFFPYKLGSDGKCVVVDAGATAAEPSGTKTLEKSQTLLHFLKKVMKRVETTSKIHIKEKFLSDLRKIRENNKGPDLERVVVSMRDRMDDPQLLSSDIVFNMLLSYREIQDYNAMVTLVEEIEDVRSQVNETMAIQQLYAFALNRRKKPGDRDKALEFLSHLQCIEQMETPIPDLICLLGRIYKDKFTDSGRQDTEALTNAIKWYQKGFEAQPNEYAGINLATLLVISGEKFSQSTKLQQIALTLNNLIGRKGYLSTLTDYWTVATFFEISVLAEDYSKAVQAAECMMKLDPPDWYLKSTMENIRLITSSRQEENINHNKRDKELFNFWIDFFEEGVEKEKNENYFFTPVLILEPQKVLMPSHFQANMDDEGSQSIRIWHVAPPEDKKIHEWKFMATSLKSVSHYKRDNKAMLLYVYDNSDDFHIFFPSETHKQRYYELVVKMMESVGNPINMELDMEGEIRSTGIRYEYEKDSRGQRVKLGQGSYGCVYAARDLDTQVKIAIKEVPEDSQVDFQILHQEISLHSKLTNPHIVKYLGSLSEDGYFKIFMEQVPGGLLSTLLREIWGPLKDNENTIIFYTRQMVKGLEYLHKNKIVHRDIKGDNVLINTFNGNLKISDFGTSKRLAGKKAAGTFTGTMQFMAPEVIDKGMRGYGQPADIWSLGCTIIEMATGKLPFFELGCPQAAMFKVGYYKIHPEIPECLSENAKDFLLKCFEPVPDKRPTASELLEHSFLAELKTNKVKDGSEFNRSFSSYEISFSVNRKLTHYCMKLCSSFRHAPFINSHVNITSHCTFMHSCSEYTSSIPNSSPSPIPDYTLIPDTAGVREGGFSLTKKDSERRTTLVNLLNEDKEQICERWLNTVSKEANTSIHRVNKVFILQNKVLKQRKIPPHWMFHLDDLLRSAVQSAITVLSPGCNLPYNFFVSINCLIFLCFCRCVAS
ncbi:hypothetical protein HELRODRAFT_62517 [Helobdella robusta]|uniref:Protein kinase domain-containing protein n=1 Tax=Helobdella robusta TaxID=6412 RepID=T1FX18_HELRO|nr:hypothetical protein HELRODRAFT_62517 [Helobdella robusta]ESO12712.1 hypothetical protein HELRODRAFT_62517 [Helobdella robusta]